tara:strand:- start:12523 stop:15300 length:2778 start_codon:yes stop_codon:yes gene_type:complete
MKILSILFFVFILFAVISLIVWAISNMINKNSVSSKKSIDQPNSDDSLKKIKIKKNISSSNINKSSTNNSNQNEFLDEKTRTKLQKLNFSEEERNRGLMYVFLIFKNLKGVSFKEVNIKPLNTFSKSYFKKENEPNWQFGILNFASIFRSFSDNLFESEVNRLLKENNIDINQVENTVFGKCWAGNGFKIEIPKVQGHNVILISNENVINSERFVASIREEKKIEEYIVDSKYSINPNNIFFLKENQTIAKLFGVQLEDLKDIPSPTINNSELLVKLFLGEIEPYTTKQISEGLPLIEQKVFRNLSGFPFHKVQFKVNDGSTSPDEFFTSDVDGSWYYATMNFSMLFKCFSDSTFNKELKKLLIDNQIDVNDIVKEGQYDYWAGDGFKIECPKINNSNVIIITNENITRSDATEFKSTENSVLNKVNWVKGIEKIYNGKKALKNSSNILEEYFNVPLYFDEEKDSNEFILIPNQNIVPSKILIDEIIENNGGKDQFKFVGDVEDNWKYVHEGKNFLIGYLSKSYCIRLNQLVKPTFSNDLEELEYNLQNLKLPENSDPKSWINILNTRANGRKMFMETLKQTYWEMSLAHTEEYITKYKEDILRVEDIYYRIDVYNAFINEYEKFFNKYQDLDKPIPDEIENKFFALIESLIGAEYTLIIMKEKGEDINEAKIYRRINRPNQAVIDELLQKNEKKNFIDKNEFTYYKGYLFNGKWKSIREDETLDTCFRFGLKHGVEKKFDKEGNLVEERIWFNDKYVGNNKDKIITDEKTHEIINSLSGFNDVQKQKIQLSVFVKCVFELIQVDGKITEEENTAFSKFSNEISKKFPGSIDEGSDEYNFLMGDRENYIEALKSFDEDDKNLFFETLIEFALVDEDLALEEANYISELAMDVYPDLNTRDKLMKWLAEIVKNKNLAHKMMNNKKH